MAWFKRWLLPFMLAFGAGASTMGCHVLFGDFEVGHGSKAGAGGTDSNSSGGANAFGGAAGNGQPSGPIVVVPRSDLFTSDLGAQAKFYVSLAKQPAAPVTIPITSANLAQGTVSPDSLTFTTDDWNAPQAVTVTGVPDPQVGNQAYSVEVGPAKSDDQAVHGAKVVVPITNIDNDGAGFFVTPTAGLTTTDAGGQAVFTVVLNKRPDANVVFSLTSSDPSIGTVTPSSLTFTADNWSAPQTVTLTGVSDNVAGGDRVYQISLDPQPSADPSYATLPPQTLNVLNRDTDSAGVTVVLATGIDPSGILRLRTSENAESASFTVQLNNEPKQDVTIEIASGSGEGTVSPASLTFTPLSWAAPQFVTVVGVDNDNIADGNQPYQVTLGPIKSGDNAYASLTPAALPPVNVVNVDNDKADVALTLLTSLDPNDASQLLTSEKKTPATFSIALTSKPKAAVRFDLNSTNPLEGTVSATQLDFTTDNWNVAQKVTVTGMDDNTKDGNVVYAVRLSSPMTTDFDYQKLPVRDVKVVNLDDDVAGITPPKLLSGIDAGTKLVTAESGGSATFSVSLTSRPGGDVKVPVMSSDPSEGTVMPATLTFTPANYATPQVVTVTGVDDPGVDGNQAYTITIGPSTSSGDPNYVGLSQSVKVTNQDDDSAYIVATPSYSGTTTEQGGTAKFGLSLHSQPTAPVTLTLKSSSEKEGKVTPTSLSFTMANWSTAQTVTVTGQDDATEDGDQMYTVSVTGSSTGDQNYAYAATTLSLINKDDDKALLKVTAAANLQTNESGGKATFTVALNSQPTGNVNVTVSSSAVKEGTAAPASLAFTTNNWSTPQTVTVTGVEDSVADGNQTYTVTLKTASSSADPKYAQLPASTVSLTNVNDDIVGILVTSTSCETTPGTTATFTVALRSQPLGPVSIALSSDNPMQGTVPSVPLSFTTANWSAAQIVTVTGVDDATMGMMTPYKIVTAPAVSALDPNYNGFNAADVSCVNTTAVAPPDP
ncbi:MAG TPA: Calx-beta domain-containing protein [Polyangiaceae bacterium]|nr:Calx-beta domain-containing protein [Polyangiaceae bacterium]